MVVGAGFGGDFGVFRSNLRRFKCSGMLLLLRATCGAGLSRRGGRLVSSGEEEGMN
jgi:hypothetical protein